MSRRNRFLLIGALFVALSLPIAALGSHTFTDVPDDHTFHTDIDWLADAGITKGCNPPLNTKYCPDTAVTRGAMAAFLRRMATGNILSADTLDGKHATELIRVDGAIGSPIEGVTSVQNVVSKTVNVPTAGYLTITSSIWLEDWCGDSTYSQGVVGILVNDEVATLGATYLADCLTEWGSSDITALTVTVAVPEGNAVVDIRAFADDSFGPITVGESSVSILFSPFGSGAVRPAGTAGAGARSDIDVSDFMIP